MNDLKSGTNRKSTVGRRRFIKQFVVGTAFSVLAGRDWFATLVADCQPAQAGAGILKVRVSDFPALQNQNGSVRLAINTFTLNGPTGTFYPVLVNRGAGDQFFTLRTRCSHMGCVVPPFSATAGASVCPCHGSRYAINGTVLQGPAPSALTQYTNSFDGTILCIQIPGLGYSVSSSSVQDGTGARFSLQFPTFRNAQYQVLFHQSTIDPGAAVPFATTATGSATNTTLTGNGSPATVYVDRATDAGFYTLAINAIEG
jgi:Rieske Fe-S protein